MTVFHRLVSPPGPGGGSADSGWAGFKRGPDLPPHVPAAHGEPFVIAGAEVVSLGDTVELRAEVGGRPVWFRVPSARWPHLSADPFLAVALLPAMRSGRPIRVEASLPVSPRLYASLNHLQEIFFHWFPGLCPVDIAGGVPQAPPPGTGTGAMFSGGVDSCFTMLRGTGNLDHAVFIDRVDTGKRFDSASYAAAVPGLAAMAEYCQASLLEAATNAKEFSHSWGVHWHEAVGAGLSAMGMALGLTELRIPGSSPWSDLGGFGTHPVTDPMWSTEALTVVHEGTGFRRIDKLRAVAQHPALCDGLRVCMEGRQGNCGHCEKCARTMTGLRIIGTGSAALPELDPAIIRGLPMRMEGIFLDWLEMLDELGPGEDPELRRALRRLVRRYRTRRATKTLWTELLG